MLKCCEPNSRQGLIFQVISQYYGIKNQLQLVEIAKRAAERAERLLKATQAKLKVELATSFPLEKAADAHRLSETGHVRGKIVLTT